MEVWFEGVEGELAGIWPRELRSLIVDLRGIPDGVGEGDARVWEGGNSSSAGYFCLSSVSGSSMPLLSSLLLATTPILSLVFKHSMAVKFGTLDLGATKFGYVCSKSAFNGLA